MKVNTRKLLSIILSAALVIMLLVLMLNMLTSGAEKVSPEEFFNEFYNGKVQKVQYEGNFTVKVLKTDSKINPDRFPQQYDYAFNFASRAVFEGRINELLVKFEADGTSTAPPGSDQHAAQLAMMRKVYFDQPDRVTIWQVMYPILIIGALIFFGWFIITRMAQQNNQNISFGKSKARVNENVKVRFTDVAGAEEEKEELQEIIEFLKAPQKFSELGARIPHGVLLVGPPGTGKTLFAKAVAGEAGVPFFSISGSDFVEMFVGVGASRVRDLFDQAKKNTP